MHGRYLIALVCLSIMHISVFNIKAVSFNIYVLPHTKETPCEKNWMQTSAIKMVKVKRSQFGMFLNFISSIFFIFFISMLALWEVSDTGEKVDISYTFFYDKIIYIINIICVDPKDSMIFSEKKWNILCAFNLYLYMPSIML